MTLPLEYTAFVKERDHDAVVRMLVHAFAGPTDGTVTWIQNAGGENLRVVRSRDQTLGCLLRIPMGQFFGAAPVPMLGIAGVAVAPEARGMGIARFMMQQAMKHAAADGTALSSLFASTQSLYRQVGYEQAGHAFRLKIPVVHISAMNRAGAVCALTDEDRPAIESCWRSWASTHNGHIERTPYAWNRVREFRTEKFAPFGVRNAQGGLDGYLYLRQERKPDTGRQDIHISDIAFTTEHAGRTILAFLRDFASMADDVLLAAGPWHPLLSLLDQQRYEIQFKDYWMLRITHLQSALTARTFPRGLTDDLHVHISDDLIPANHGPFVISIKDTKATLTPGGRALATVSIRALAAIYAGFWSGTDAVRAGQASGDPATLMALSQALNAGTPWMQDFF